MLQPALLHIYVPVFVFKVIYLAIIVVKSSKNFLTRTILSLFLNK